MKYTTARPTVAGFYWARCQKITTGGEYETVVKVSASSSTGGRPDHVFWDGENVSISDERLLAFAGPIPFPEHEQKAPIHEAAVGGGCSCNLCGASFPVRPMGVHVSEAELYYWNWIPLRGQVFCDKCALRALTTAVSVLMRSVCD